MIPAFFTPPLHVRPKESRERVLARQFHGSQCVYPGPDHLGHTSAASSDIAFIYTALEDKRCLLTVLLLLLY